MRYGVSHALIEATNNKAKVASRMGLWLPQREQPDCLFVACLLSSKSCTPGKNYPHNLMETLLFHILIIPEKPHGIKESRHFRAQYFTGFRPRRPRCGEAFSPVPRRQSGRKVPHGSVSLWFLRPTTASGNVHAPAA